MYSAKKKCSPSPPIMFLCSLRHFPICWLYSCSFNFSSSQYGLIVVTTPLVNACFLVFSLWHHCFTCAGSFLSPLPLCFVLIIVLVPANPPWHLYCTSFHHPPSNIWLFLFSSIGSELNRGNFCGCWTFIQYCLRCPFHYLSLHPFSVKSSVLPTATTPFHWSWIVPSVIRVCVLRSEVQRTTISASWLFAFYLSFRWFEPTSSGTEAQHIINCASQTAVRVWGKIQVFIIKLMNAYPTKKKNREFVKRARLRSPAPNPSAPPTVLARLLWGYEAKFKYSLFSWWMPPLQKKKEKGVCQACSLKISCT